MSSDEFEFISREELLSGRLPSGRRANTLLFAIESQTAHLVAQSQQATALYLTVKAIEERERAFLEALAAGRDLPLQPTIQDLERYAPHWTPLVSEADVSLRAALARALGKKYVFSWGGGADNHLAGRHRSVGGDDRYAPPRGHGHTYRGGAARGFQPRWAASVQHHG